VRPFQPGLKGSMKRFAHRRTPRRMLSILATLALAAAMFAMSPPAALASMYTVTNLSDAKSGSLRQAILAANASEVADIITFRAGLTGTISLTSTLPSIDSAGGALSIRGPGANELKISGNDSVQVMQVASGASLNLSGVRISRGATQLGGFGGGISSSGSLIVSDSIFTRNKADAGGAIDSYGGGSLTVANSTFSRNRGSLGGGAINSNSSSVTVSDSTFFNNVGRRGGAIGAGATGVGGASLTVTNSTLSWNTAREGGAIWATAGVAYLDITNSTFSGNRARGTQPRNGGGAIDSNGPVAIAYSTFSGNSAATGGADLQLDDHLYRGPTVTLMSTILGSSGGSNCSVRDTGTFVDAGYNLSSDDTCGLSTANNSQPSTDPLLDGLAYNGGPTPTMLPGSPAINMIRPGTNGCGTTVPTDQTGIPRPQGSKCDIGAVEVQV